MSTILNRLVERLDVKIDRLLRAKTRLQSKHLEDKKLDQQIKSLVSIRDKLQNPDPTEGVEATIAKGDHMGGD